MSAVHFVQYVLQNGDHARVRYTCEAGEQAECRKYCKLCQDEGLEACQCEYYEKCDDSGNLVSEGREPVYVYGSCNYLNWMEDAPEEMYNGGPTPVRGPEPQPIQFTWEGDYYVWEYAEVSS